MACCMARREEKDDGDIFDDGDDAAVPQKDPSPAPDPLADDSHPQSDSQPQVLENKLSCTMLIRGTVSSSVHQTCHVSPSPGDAMTASNACSHCIIGHCLPLLVLLHLEK